MLKFEYKTVNFKSPEFEDFYGTYQDDIESLFPNFDLEETSLSDIELLEVDNKICGVYITQGKGETLHIELDYVIQQYRDLGIGQEYLPIQFEKYKRKGYKNVLASTGNIIQQDYLASLGFLKPERMGELHERVL
jgi:hypothetical protein